VLVTTLGKLVAVRFRDKTLLKGRTVDFRPNREFFHLKEEGAAAAARVPMEDLKGVFFLKTPGRSPDCADRRSFEERAGIEKKVWIQFSDGESLAGWSNSFGSQKKGFYVFPADPDSNLEKAYVFRSAVDRMEQGEAAEAASRAFCVSTRGPASPPVAAEAASPASEASSDKAVGVYCIVRGRSDRRSDR